MTLISLPARTAFRRLRFGLSTLLGIRRRGFFIPYRYADAVPPALGRIPYQPLEERFAAHAPAFADILAAMDDHRAALLAIGDRPPPEPRWTQDWFPRLDAAALYTLVRRHRPRRIVEVGSGHSTRFAMRALRDEGHAASVTAIDPAPRADIRALPLTAIALPVQQAGPAPFRDLEAGDILFIDSSHVAMPGTDVDFLVSRVLPTLAEGVLVHIHDIFLPDDYPADWAWRGYNEQQVVAALLAGGGFEPIFASHYVATRMADAVRRSVAAELPLVPGARETSLWLRKTVPPFGPFTQC